MDSFFENAKDAATSILSDWRNLSCNILVPRSLSFQQILSLLDGEKEFYPWALAAVDPHSSSQQVKEWRENVETLAIGFAGKQYSHEEIDGLIGAMLAPLAGDIARIVNVLSRDGSVMALVHKIRFDAYDEEKKYERVMPAGLTFFGVGCPRLLLPCEPKTLRDRPLTYAETIAAVVGDQPSLSRAQSAGYLKQLKEQTLYLTAPLSGVGEAILFDEWEKPRSRAHIFTEGRLIRQGEPFPN